MHFGALLDKSLPRMLFWCWKPARSGSGHSHCRRRAGSRAGVPTVEEPARCATGTRAIAPAAGRRVRLPVGLEAGWCEYRHRRHGWELELAGFALYFI